MPKLRKLPLRALSAMVFAALLLAGCEVTNTNGPTPPYRPTSTSKSTITGTGGEVGTYFTVNVTLRDKANYGIGNVIPTITAVDGSGLSTGIVSAGCGTTNTNGQTTCRIKSTVAGTYTLKVLSPSVFTGGTITFVQYARSLSFSTQPSCGGDCTSQTTFATQPAVTVLDAVGTAMVGLAAYNVTFTITTPGSALIDTGGGGVASVVAAASAVTGIATAAGVGIDLVGTYTLTATATDGVSGAAITATSSSVTVVAGAATKLGFSTEPSSSTPTNTAFAQQPVVAVQDAAGNTVTSATCLVNLAFNAGNNAGDSLLGTTSKTAASGLADFSSLNVRVATTQGGTSYTLKATSQGACAALTQGTSSAFAITMAGAPYQLVLTQNPSGAALNQTWATQPIVEVQDIDGARVSSDNTTVVTLSAGAGSPTGSITGAASITVVNGVATYTGLRTTGTAAGDAGTFTLDFNGTNPNVNISGQPAGQLISTSTSQIITTAGLTPAKVRFYVQPSNGVVNTTVADIVAQVLDANGVLCSSDNTDVVTLTLAAAPAGGAFKGGSTTSLTVSGGMATFTNVAFTTAGIYQLLLSSGALSSAYSTSFAIAAWGAADHLAFIQQPSAGAATWPSAWDTQPIVGIYDAAGNLVGNSTAQVSMACVNPATCTSLFGTTTVAASNGVATFTNLRANVAAQTNVTLQTSSNGLVAAGSNSFNAP